MKTKSLILAGLALVALVSCNKEKNESPFSGDGDNAYLSVQIAYANGAATRGERDETNPFYYGSAEENAVKTADFFFYMSDGTYFSHVRQAISGTGKTHATKPADGNIEWKGNGVVVLRGLTSTNSPAYMAVVLNASDATVSALEGKSMTEAHTDVKTSDLTVADSGTNYFTMSSTVCKDAAIGDNYCAKLTSNMFKETEAEAASASGADVVEAYVERVAAKVTVDITAPATTAGTETIYKIGDFELDNATGTTKPLYLKVHGWGLNATTKDSYSFKNIDPSWTFGTITINSVTAPEFEWNDAKNHRSKWAKSTNYGDATLYYPRSFNNDNATNKNYNGYTGTMPLAYTTYTNANVALSSPAYCRENTNTETILDANNFNTTATCALLTAQVVGENGSAIALVLYENKYWTLDGYKNRVLAKYASNVPYKSAGVKATASDLEFVDANDGLIYVKFVDGTYYKDATATTAYADAAELATLWPRANTEGLGYKDGMMYYSIPIEHLRGAGTYEAKNLVEADYGVVRNHWYNLTISKIANLGRGVWNPNEQIVPDDNDAKKYYVAAQINILSWKIVKQSVEL